MPIGQPTSMGNVNAVLTQMALQWRALATMTLQQQAQLNKLGLAGLEGLGFSPADAQAVLDAANHMGTVAGVYKGTVQQGGTGGTGASLFNFEDSLTPLWAGQ